MQGDPFTYGNPIRDPGRFYGRAHEVAQIFGRLRNPEFESSSVVGDRRIGKTSLLNYIAHPETRYAYGLGGDHFIFVYADLQMVGRTMGPEQLWRQLLGSLLEQCRDDVIAAALKELLRQDRLDIFDLDLLFRKVDARGHGVVFLLDEFEQVTGNPNFGPDFFFGFRSLAIHRNVALVTSSRSELVELCHSDSVKSSPFFNIFANINLRMISAEDFMSLISQSLGPTGVRFTDREVEQILGLAGRHPYFVQVACSLLYEAYRQGEDADAREKFLADRFQTEAGPHFVDLWSNSTDPHRIVLTAASLLQLGSRRSAEFTVEALQRVYSRAEPNLAGLERRGLVMRTSTGYRLFSTALGPWIVDRIVAQFDDRQSFPEWLAQDAKARSQVTGWRRKRLRKVLPKIGPTYRQLILTWASDPQSVTAMARLLKSVLSMVS
jgi:hypothetical protein